MSTKKTSINRILENPDNPRQIKKEKFNELVESIKNFPAMLEVRPIVCVTLHDDTYRILGGNMRYRASVKAGLKEVPMELADNWSEKQKREFVIKDNLSYGEWDYDVLANVWDYDELDQFGLDIPSGMEKLEEDKQEVVFSEYLNESQNYVVLTFDNDIDWLSAQTHFDLKSVHSKRQNGKPWSKGIGRVINGAEYLKQITSE